MTTTVYARGFLGSPASAARVERTQQVKPFPTIFDTGAHSSLVVVNPDVMRIYEQLVRRDYKSESWDFREQAVTIALNAFGTNDFVAWVRAQLMSATVSQTHMDMIDDMINFVLNGQRRLPPKTWEDLINPQARSGKIILGGHLSQMFPDYNRFGMLDRTDYTVFNTITDFIASYLANESGTGFSDMVVSLNTLFGDFTFH